MAIKWKNRIKIVVWSFLFTFGISGILFFFNYGLQYVHRDYFHTTQFQDELGEFASYLNLFELNRVPLEEAKKSITVSKEEIDEHRYRYGTLPEQIDNIKGQYEQKIREAADAGNDVVEKSLTSERDRKIEDITKNFESEEYVKPKVIKEKEQKLEKYYKEIENSRSNYLRYKKSLQYYFKNDRTGKVYTNTNTDSKELNKNNTLFIKNMTITRDYIMGFYGILDADDNFPLANETFSGVIAVPKTLASSNLFIHQNETYKRSQLITLIYVLSALVSLLISVIYIKKSKAIPAEIAGWAPYYNKLPIDIRAVCFIVTGYGVIFSLMVATNNQFPYLYENPYIYGFELSIFLVVSSFLVGLTYVQWKILFPAMKDWQTVKNEWAKCLFIKVWQRTLMLGKKTAKGVNEAFLDQSIGTQIFILLGVIFSLGLAVILIAIHPIFLFLYVLILGVVGIPIIMLLVKKIGYFNKIVEKTSELAAGNLGQDLEVSGNTILADLAGNINVLKQGVKTSQNEQAKSERLKTELITNVSHDLRTPLTSIITYTELLKTTEDLSLEDRAAYLAIIDRKSQRLKVLIEDLFEVSKMASGNIKLNKEKVDLVQLLQQALAEHDDTITESNLQFRVTNTEKPIFSYVDGQKLWRVFDNLIGNILKYSLENSRVYIHVSKENGRAVISFKNVSKYELNQYSEELVERFKRGDTSRHTDGSGLGLAIAKSIVELHEGILDIETDGDLFKVTISLRLEE
ncbi:sensor histidine kinase [Neobacillus kokaensis]|uniref:histidine kinase n=1 Tax=Neobacillus kokaensis TaxID=2759023 RepID=A0ABQ3N5S8_9BACI|nr:HAMP domain-containing sensor histidine kinase [Neobacillus kokaensis]GHH98947.1 two-component sensor histidine kinase [Neobacillus kokaensis]